MQAPHLDDTYTAGFDAGYASDPLTAEQMEALFTQHSAVWQLGWQAGQWEARRRESYDWGPLPQGWEEA